MILFKDTLMTKEVVWPLIIYRKYNKLLLILLNYIKNTDNFSGRGNRPFRPCLATALVNITKFFRGKWKAKMHFTVLKKLQFFISFTKYDLFLRTSSYNSVKNTNQDFRECNFFHFDFFLRQFVSIFNTGKLKNWIINTY